MAEQPAQNAANHTHFPRLAFVAALSSLIALILFLIEAVRRPSLLSVALLLLTLAVWCLIAISRYYIVRLQDRIIRLEMRVRLARLGREAEYERLSKRQIVALRFASDAELPALVERAIAENLDSRQIKLAIVDWQPDHHRT